MVLLDFKKNPESGDVINRVRVHYTDGSHKEFDVIDWEITLEEGRRLWKSTKKNLQSFMIDTAVENIIYDKRAKNLCTNQIREGFNKLVGKI